MASPTQCGGTSAASCPEGRKTEGQRVSDRQGAKTPSKRESVLRGPDHSLDSIFYQLDVEVDQQPKLKFGQLQVGQHLSFMNRQQLLHCLEFNDQFFLKEQIQP